MVNATNIVSHSANISVMEAGLMASSFGDKRDKPLWNEDVQPHDMMLSQVSLNILSKWQN